MPPGIGLVISGPPWPTSVYFAPDGTATFNPNADPFLPSGNGLPEGRNAAWAARYNGGNMEHVTARPQIGAEDEFMIGSRVLIKAFEMGRDRGAPPLPPGFRWLPDNPSDPWDGVPTDRERVDFCFCVSPSSAFVATVYGATVDPANPGVRPENPMALDPDNPNRQQRHPDGTPILYYVERHKTGMSIYFKNSAPGAHGYGKGYPQVFGEDPQGGSPQPTGPGNKPAEKPGAPPAISLSEHTLETLRLLPTWETIGPGRKARIQALINDLKAKGLIPP